MSSSVPSPLFGQISLTGRRFGAAWNRVGQQTQFYIATLRSIAVVMRNYQVELLRQIGQMALGTGALILIGGAVVIIGFLTMSTGALVSLQGYSLLANVGVDALAGFIAAFADVRLGCPLVATVGLAATIGAGATAQLGAMRINEEIDALEVMGVRSLAYLASTRVVAGVVVIVPLYCIALLTSFAASRFVVAMYGQSSGVYYHYFNAFLNPLDMVWSTFLVVLAGTVIMLIHTYYGYTAAGGPAGVGEAVGRAVRASLIAAVFVVLFAALAIYGEHGNFHLAE